MSDQKLIAKTQEEVDKSVAEALKIRESLVGAKKLTSKHLVDSGVKTSIDEIKLLKD